MDDHVVIGWRDIDVPRHQEFLSLGMFGWNAACGLQEHRQYATRVGMKMNDDTDGHRKMRG